MRTSVAVLSFAVVIQGLLSSLGSTTAVCNYEWLNNNDGYVTSPNYPSSYPPEVCIIWLYSGPSGTSIHIIFIDVDIPGDPYSCSNDFLKIGPVNEAVYCGNTLTPYTAVFSSRFNQLHIVLNSTNFRIKGRGFKIYYEIAPTPDPTFQQCNLQLTEASGKISSNYLPSIITKSGSCSLLLHYPVTVGKRVTYSLTIEMSRFASNSILKVYDGPNKLARVLYFSAINSSHIKSSQDHVLIYYSPGMGASDFFTIYFETDETCAIGWMWCGYGEVACYKYTKHCDFTWDCPLEGGDERSCSSECPNSFSCGSGAGCYDKTDICDGREKCQNAIDEKNCIVSSFVIVATATSCLVCTLVLVIIIGCACHFRRRRIHHLHGPYHDTPLSRQLSEMLEQRAPPPPYHEAMLTSCPYIEAYSDLHSESENPSDVFNNGYPESSDSTSARDQTQRNNHESSRRGWNYQTHNGNQDPMLIHRSEPDTLIETGTFDLFSDSEGDDALCEDIAEENPPAYEGFDNVAFIGDDNSQILSNRDSVIQMGMLSNITQSPEISQASAISRNPEFRSSLSNWQHFSCNDEGSRNNDCENVSASISALERDEVLEENMNVTEEDSDSDCILADNDDYDDSTGSDTVCLLV